MRDSNQKRPLERESSLRPFKRHTFPPKLGEFSDHTFSDLFPYIGPPIERVKRWKLFKFQEKAARIVKGENVIFTVGLGGGKTMTAVLLAFECALRKKARMFSNGGDRETEPDSSLPEGHSILVFSSASLALHVYEKAKELSQELFGGEVSVRRYTYGMSNSELRNVREGVSGIDLLIITWDYYYRTLTKWSPHLDEEGCNEDWFNFLMKPSMVFMDEVDFMGDFTVANASTIAVAWRKANPEAVLVVLSGTISNGEEFGKKFFRCDSIKVIEGSERRGRIKVQLIRDAVDEEEWEGEDLREVRVRPLLDSIVQLNQGLKRVKADAERRRISLEKLPRALVFVDDKALLDKIEEALENDVDNMFKVLHGDRTARENFETIEEFRKGETLGLLTTKKLEVGIDVPQVHSGVIFGIPPIRRPYLQRLRRFGRDPEGTSAIRIILREQVPLELLMIENKEEREKFLFSEEPAPYIFSPDNVRSLLFGVLFAMTVGMNKLDDLGVLVKGFENAEEKLQKVLFDLYSSGCIRVTEKKVSPTRFTSSQIFKFNFRPIVPKYEVQEWDPKIKAYKTLGTISRRRLLRQGREGDSMVFNKKRYIVQDVYPRKKVVIVKRGHSSQDTWNDIQIEIVPENVLAVSRDLGVSLAEVEVSMSVRKRRLYDRKSGELYKEEDAEEDTSVETYESYGVSFEFPDPEWTLSKRCVQIIGAAILATLRTLVEIDPREMSIGIGKTHSKTCSVLYLVDESGPAGYAQRVYEKSREILEETLKNLRLCQCRSGCWKCLYMGSLPWSFARIGRPGFKEMRRAMDALQELVKPISNKEVSLN